MIGDGRHVLHRRQDVRAASRSATIIVVAIAVLGSLTVLPACSRRLGDRVEKGADPVPRRLLQPTPMAASGAGSSTAYSPPGRPALLAGGALVALAVPALGMKTPHPGSGRPPAEPVRSSDLQQLKRRSPASCMPATVMVEGRGRPYARIQGGDCRRSREGASPRPCPRLRSNRRQPRRHRRARHDPDRRQRHRRALRSGPHSAPRRHGPRHASARSRSRVGVTGATADRLDSNSQMNHAAPLVFAFVLILAFILLLSLPLDRDRGQGPC